MSAPIGLLIPAGRAPLQEVALDDFQRVQALVGGYVQALPIPAAFDKTGRATAYVNEDGKYNPDCLVNMRATDFMVPGVGLQFGDYIAGAFVLVGFDPLTGEHTAELPADVVARARLIEREAGS